MIQSQLALIQREFWEHRGIYVTPLVIGIIISLMSVTGQVSISGSEHVDVAILGMSNIGEEARATAITVPFACRVPQASLATAWRCSSVAAGPFPSSSRIASCRL